MYLEGDFVSFPRSVVTLFNFSGYSRPPLVAGEHGRVRVVAGWPAHLPGVIPWELLEAAVIWHSYVIHTLVKCQGEGILS